LEASQKAADELFGARIRSVKTARDKASLAAEIVETALNAQERSADQFVLLTIARDVAAGAGDAATALQAVEKLVERFDVPAANLKAVTLVVAFSKVTSSTHHQAAEAARSVVGQLAEAGQYGLALSVCEAARSAAQKARENSLLREWSAKATELQRWQEEFHEYRRALALVENNPAEPTANLAAGRYLCFVKDDWRRGLPHLAVGGDAELRAVAIKELRGATSAEEQARVGDAWWALAKTKEGSERDTLRLRAAFWYRQAEPKLAPGPAAQTIRQRLNGLTKLGGRGTPRGPHVSRASQAPPLAMAPFDEKTAKQHQAAWAAYLQMPVEMANPIGMRFVLIPPGEFEMGSTKAEAARLLEEAQATRQPSWYIDRLPSEVPKHRVQITQPFWLSRHEVTRGQFRRFVDDRGYRTEAERDGQGGYGLINGSWKQDPRFVWNAGRRGGPADDHPLVNVSWNDAAAFCAWLSEKEGEKSHLPSEVQWEYACRAGATTTWYSGDDEGTLRKHAWFQANAEDKTHPVGQKSPNAWGLYDMHGNVWEWCQDRFGEPYPTSPLEDPSRAAGGSSRVRRGGGWAVGAPVCRASYRGWFAGSGRYGDLGFRIARTVSSSPSR
jgi:formylglycine-generating enzyme required for sulfatase activity